MLRRIVAGLALALAAATGAAACPGGATPALTEGPFYRQGSPERTVLREASAAGRRLLLTGVVYDSGCRPVAGAWLDFWQADSGGSYDNRGFGFRGHQVTDAEGRYTLDTVVPGEYPGRTSHIHVKVRAPRRAGRAGADHTALPARGGAQPQRLHLRPGAGGGRARRLRGDRCHVRFPPARDARGALS